MNRYKNQYNSSMKQTKNNKWFSIVFAMGIVLTVSLTITYLLEYVMPYSKDTKWIEFSSNAFYQSSTAVEDALFYVANNNLWDEANDNLEIWWPLSITTDMWYDIVARWDTIPPLGEWNSEYDPDWNRLKLWKPLQLEIGWDSWDGWELRFRVPDTWVGNNIYLKSMTWGIVWWQLSAIDDTLNSWTWANRIQENILKTGYNSEFDVNSKDWVTLENSISTFGTFYGSHCSNTTDKCTLKISVINDLILNNANSTPIPYLEYRITWMDNAPLRYTQVKATWYSNGFKKDIDIKIPQQTVNEAFDFTVFQ